MKKVFYYIIIPIVLYGIFVKILFYESYGGRINNTLENALLIIQSLAIIIGGLWAYYKFGWEKKCENIISLKAALMEFSARHNLSAAEYHKDKDIVGYKIRLLPHYDNLSQKIHLSYYVPAKLRKNIFDTIWLTIGNDTGENHQKLTANWDKFEKQLKGIFNDFESIISI